MKLKSLINIDTWIVAITLCLLIIGCKKYPENTLVLSKPSNVISSHAWFLDKFSMNGIDSTNNNVRIFVNNGVSFDKNEITIVNDDHYSGFWKLSRNKKEITIRFNSDFAGYTTLNNCPCYNYLNIFAAYSTEIMWRIEKLTKQQLWLSTNYGGTAYYIKLRK